MYARLQPVIQRGRFERGPLINELRKELEPLVLMLEANPESFNEGISFGFGVPERVRQVWSAIRTPWHLGFYEEAPGGPRAYSQQSRMQNSRYLLAVYVFVALVIPFSLAVSYYAHRRKQKERLRKSMADNSR